MSILKWLKEVLNSKKDITEEFKLLDPKDIPPEIYGLDIRGAINAHDEWMNKFKGYLNGQNCENLDPEKVKTDCNCLLGKWIYSEGQKKFGKYEIFSELKNTHKNFHIVAGSIAEKIKKGEQQEAQKELQKLRAPSAEVKIKLIQLSTI